MNAELKIIFDSQSGFTVILTGDPVEIDNAVNYTSDTGVGPLLRFILTRAYDEMKL